MDEFLCPWCGEDLLPLFTSMKPCSYDAVYEAHAEDCAVFQAELNGEATQQEPPCSRDEG